MKKQQAIAARAETISQLVRRFFDSRRWGILNTGLSPLVTIGRCPQRATTLGSHRGRRISPLSIVLVAHLAIGVFVPPLNLAHAELIAYYPFDDGKGTVVTDASNNGFHAIASNTLSFSDDGFYGSAADFGEFDNGAVLTLPDAFTSTDDGYQRILASQEFTISYWMNRQGDPATDTIAFRFGGSGQITAYAPWSNGDVFFDIAGCCGPRHRVTKSLDGADTDGKWHHLAYVKRKDDGAQKSVSAIYLDGEVLVASPGWFGEATPTIDDVIVIDRAWIGAGREGANSQDGLIDDFAIWDEALTPDFIAALAKGGAVLPQRQLLGDFNDDGVIDLADFGIMSANFGDKFARNESVDHGDFNGDLTVDLKDFLQFREVFNSATNETVAVPESTAPVLWSLAIAVTLSCARTRSSSHPL